METLVKTLKLMGTVNTTLTGRPFWVLGRY